MIACVPYTFAAEAPACTCTLTDVNNDTHTHMRMHACTHARMHACAQMYKHVQTCTHATYQIAASALPPDSITRFDLLIFLHMCVSVYEIPHCISAQLTSARPQARTDSQASCDRVSKNSQQGRVRLQHAVCTQQPLFSKAETKFQHQLPQLASLAQALEPFTL